MPFGSEDEEEGIGLALSGGGFRAMLFHAGSLWRLNELGLLPNLSRVSSVSGGSMTAGILAVRWNELTFQAGVATNFNEKIVDPLLSLARRSVDVPAIALGLIPGLSAARIAAWLFSRHLVGKATLQDLPDEPRFVFNSTHLASATNWRFSKPYMGSYRLGLVLDPEETVATAIAASAAFPPVLSPLTLRLNPASYQKTEGADLHHRTDLLSRVSLTDGGVYDNLGLETVWNRYKTILSSDAGGVLTVKQTRFWYWERQLLRVIDTASEQARALRRRRLVSDFLDGSRNGTLWRTGTDIRQYPAETPFSVDPDWRFRIAQIRTRLNPFSEEERSRLVNWGYVVSDVALRSWYVTDAPAPSGLPFPAYDFAASPGVDGSAVASG